MIKSTRNELPRCRKVATKVRRRCSMGTTMKHRIVTGALVLAFGLSAMASTRQNPFDVIVARNVFGLRPIPETKSPEPEAPPAPLLPEIRLTGITTLLGKPIVTLQYEDKQAKKTEFPPLLAEGESYRDLKVEHIDLEAQTVAVRVGQTRDILDFVQDGVKPSTPKAMAQAGSPIPPSFQPPPIAPRSNPGQGGGREVLVTGGGAPAPMAPPQLTPEQIRQRIEEARQKQGLPPLPTAPARR